MDNFSTKDIIHIGTELVIIGGVAFFLSKKCNSLSERVGFLEQKIQEYDEIVRVMNIEIQRLKQGVCSVPQYRQQRRSVPKYEEKSDEEIIRDELESDDESETEVLKKKEKKVRFRNEE
jgi:hypothetical protein